MGSQNYEDLVGEAVRMLHEHGGHREAVARRLRERLVQERELQQVLLGEELPPDERRRGRLRERAIEGIYDLVDVALRRLNSSR